MILGAVARVRLARAGLACGASMLRPLQMIRGPMLISRLQSGSQTPRDPIDPMDLEQSSRMSMQEVLQQHEQPKKRSLLERIIRANTRMMQKLVGPEVSPDFYRRSAVQSAGDHLILYELGPRQQWAWRNIFRIVPLVTLYLVASFTLSNLRPITEESVSSEEPVPDLFRLHWADGTLGDQLWAVNVVFICTMWVIGSVLSLQVPQRFVRRIEYDRASRNLRVFLGLPSRLSRESQKPLLVAPRDLDLLSKPPTYTPKARERIGRLRITGPNNKNIALMDMNGKYSSAWLSLYPDDSLEWNDAIPADLSVPDRIWNQTVKYRLRPMRAFGDVFFYNGSQERALMLQRMLHQSDEDSMAREDLLRRGLDKPAVQRKIEELLRQRRLAAAAAAAAAADKTAKH